MSYIVILMSFQTIFPLIGYDVSYANLWRKSYILPYREAYLSWAMKNVKGTDLVSAEYNLSYVTQI
jgi:hypothetical protein